MRRKHEARPSLAAVGLTAAVFASLLALAGTASAASPVVVYDNIPDPMPSSVPSLSYEGANTSEFGGQVGLAGTSRTDPAVSVLMVSFACESGHWSRGACATTPGATFSHPITLNVYDVGPGDSVGSLITSDTETFSLPYRPSADYANCPGTEKWFDGTSCNNGYAFTISFDLAGTTLPDNVILGVAFNTSTKGYAPIGTATACYSTPAGCPYDSLNVGTNAAPTVGTALPTGNDAYLNAGKGSYYCDGGAGGVGVFRLDAGCWTGYLPAFEVEVPASAPATKDDCKNDGWMSFSSPTFKNQGDCVSWVEHNIG